MLTTLIATAIVTQAGEFDLTSCWDCPGPLWLEVFDAAVRGASFLTFLMTPANLVLLAVFASRSRIPVSREGHRVAGWALYAYGIASTLLGGVALAAVMLYPMPGEWALALFFAGPSLVGLVTWLVQFRRVTEAPQMRVLIQ